MTYSKFKTEIQAIATIIQKMPDSAAEKAFNYLMLAMLKGEITIDDFNLHHFATDHLDDDDFFDDDDDFFDDDDDDDDKLFDKN